MGSYPAAQIGGYFRLQEFHRLKCLLYLRIGNRAHLHFNVYQNSSILATCSSKIQDALVEDAPPLASKGGFIAKGFNQQLDDLRQVAFSGKDYLLKIQQRG